MYDLYFQNFNEKVQLTGGGERIDQKLFDGEKNPQKTIPLAGWRCVQISCLC